MKGLVSDYENEKMFGASKFRVGHDLLCSVIVGLKFQEFHKLRDVTAGVQNPGVHHWVCTKKRDKAVI